MQHIQPIQRHQFNQRVWEAVRRVPFGRVITYGQVAGLVGPPPGVGPDVYQAWGARWVGSAMAACPEDVPWQRVINAQGKISLRPGAGGASQHELLRAEGVVFDASGRIDLKRFGWNPEPPAQAEFDI